MSQLRKVSDVVTEPYDPIPWKEPRSPLILVPHFGQAEFASNGVKERRRLVERALAGEGTLLLAWTGNWSTDVFVVDDLPRAEGGLR